MIEERLTFDCNSKTEAIVTSISERLKQGYKISLLFTKPASTTKSPSTKQVSEQHLQQSIIYHSQIGPNPIASQIMPKDSEILVPEPDETTLSLVALEQKLSTAKLQFEEEKYQLTLVQLDSLQQTLAQQLKTGKLMFPLKKQIIILSIQAYYYQSQCLKQLGKNQDAIEKIETCLHQYVINDQEILGQLTVELALLYMSANRYNRALDLFQKLLIFYENLNWKSEIAFVLVYIGFIYALYGQVDDAKLMACEAIEICKSVLPIYHIRTREIYFHVGYIYFIIKDLDFSQEYLEHALPLDEADTNRQLQINVLNLLAMVNHMKGLDIQAIKLYKKALEISHEKYKGKIFNNLGLVYMEQGDLNKAKSAFKKAHQLLKAQLNHAVTRAKKNFNFLLNNIQYI